MTQSQILTYDLSTGQWMTDRSTFAFATRGKLAADLNYSGIVACSALRWQSHS